jgi:hypothetical protein
VLKKIAAPKLIRDKPFFIKTFPLIVQIQKKKCARLLRDECSLKSHGLAISNHVAIETPAVGGRTALLILAQKYSLIHPSASLAERVTAE